MSKKRKPVPLGAIVALGVVGFVGVSLFVSYVLAQFPSPSSVCAKQCATQGKIGEMKHIYPATMTAGMRGRGPQECKCK